MEIIKPWENLNLRLNEKDVEFPVIKPLSFDMEKFTINVKPIEKIVPMRVPVIKRSSAPYWEEQGWIKLSNDLRGNTYHGCYKGILFSCNGLIDEKFFPLKYEFYIFNPSEKLRKHSHWPCFDNYKGGGEYGIHFYENPRDIDSGILAIEQILSEAFRDY